MTKPIENKFREKLEKIRDHLIQVSIYRATNIPNNEYAVVYNSFVDQIINLISSDVIGKFDDVKKWKHPIGEIRNALRAEQIQKIKNRLLW